MGERARMHERSSKSWCVQEVPLAIPSFLQLRAMGPCSPSTWWGQTAAAFLVTSTHVSRDRWYETLLLLRARMAIYFFVEQEPLLADKVEDFRYVRWVFHFKGCHWSCIIGRTRIRIRSYIRSDLTILDRFVDNHSITLGIVCSSAVLLFSLTQICHSTSGFFGYNRLLLPSKCLGMNLTRFEAHPWGSKYSGYNYIEISRSMAQVDLSEWA